jgi:hypothetical protein
MKALLLQFDLELILFYKITGLYKPPANTAVMAIVMLPVRGH